MVSYLKVIILSFFNVFFVCVITIKVVLNYYMKKFLFLLCCIFQNESFIWLGEKFCSQDSSVPLPDYFLYCLFECTRYFCNTHLNCCTSCGAKSYSLCMDNCSDCASIDHFFFVFVLNCYNGYTTLIHHTIYFGKILPKTGLSHSHLRISKNKVNCYQKAGVTCPYFLLLCHPSFFPGISSSPWIFDRSKSSPSMQGSC